MSYITGRGKEAKKALTEEKQDFSKYLAKFKNGTTLRVRIPSDDMYTSYKAHSAYKCFYTTPCSKAAGKRCAYCEASAKLYKEAFAAKDAGDEKKFEEIKNDAYTLKAKDRGLFGFFDLETGEPIVVDTTGAQATSLIAQIEKNAKHIGKLAFELSKEGEGTKSAFLLTPIIDMDELTDKQRANFEACGEKEFDDTLFEKVFTLREWSDQLDDLRKFGVELEEGSAENGEDVNPVNNGDDDGLPW
jgi:hypothetical protein